MTLPASEWVAASGKTVEVNAFRCLADEEQSAAASAATVPALAYAAAALRLVEQCLDRLAWIGERASSENVVAEAQRRAGRLVARLALVGGALEAITKSTQDA